MRRLASLAFAALPRAARALAPITRRALSLVASRALSLVAALALFPAAGLAQGGSPQPSVLVQTAVPHHGNLPRTLEAYGTMQAAPDGGSETISLLRGGQLVSVMTFLGQAVRKGQPLLIVRIDPSALAGYRQAAAALALARGDRARAAQMLAQHLATRDQLAQADKAVADAQATLDALNRAGGGSAEQTVAAPFDGVVANLLVSPGARVAAQAALLTVVRSGRLVATVGVEPAQRALVGAGQPARIVPLYGSGGEPGSVVSIGAMLDPQSRLVPVIVDPPDPPVPSATDPAASATGLIPGDPVRVVIQVGQMTGWLVPRDAVLTDGKGAYVFQLDGDKAARVAVTLVGTVGDTTVIDGPIVPARPLVTSGNYQLQDGMAVRTDQAAPPANPPPAKP
ncbi:efflux RND transporter periplasmic adaptor subunit [Rhodopila sp.]|uniref:efflux RND transporter periplasmic adaptor subunit n=1 Tax=Rhodopila sp. TaxID=2480087 RepID=UPI003D117E60